MYLTDEWISCYFEINFSYCLKPAHFTAAHERDMNI